MYNIIGNFFIYRRAV